MMFRRREAFKGGDALEIKSDIYTEGPENYGVERNKAYTLDEIERLGYRLDGSSLPLEVVGEYDGVRVVFDRCCQADDDCKFIPNMVLRGEGERVVWNRTEPYSAPEGL